MQESFPLKGTYADAAPLGPLMELRADGQNTFTADRAAQSLDYWRAIAQQLLSDANVSGSAETLNAYSHDIVSAAHLLAAHNFNAEAEQVCHLASQVAPYNPEAAIGLTEMLAHNGRANEAKQVLDEFRRRFPAELAAIEKLRGSIIWSVPQPRP